MNLLSYSSVSFVSFWAGPKTVGLYFLRSISIKKHRFYTAFHLLKDNHAGGTNHTRPSSSFRDDADFNGPGAWKMFGKCIFYALKIVPW